MKIIEKKILKDYFDKIQDGSKTFELRLADWECIEGDVLILKEINESREYTGREVRKKVGYVIKTKNIKLFSEEEVNKHGYQVISLVDEDKI